MGYWNRSWLLDLHAVAIEDLLRHWLNVVLFNTILASPEHVAHTCAVLEVIECCFGFNLSTRYEAHPCAVSQQAHQSIWLLHNHPWSCRAIRWKLLRILFIRCISSSDGSGLCSKRHFAVCNRMCAELGHNWVGFQCDIDLKVSFYSIPMILTAILSKLTSLLAKTTTGSDVRMFLLPVSPLMMDEVTSHIHVIDNDAITEDSSIFSVY